MPRSSRHRSHKERKHSSKDARDYSDSEDHARMKERDTTEDEGSVRFSRELASGEKRKKDEKISSGNGGADAGEVFVSSKRRKEKTDGSNGGDRWDVVGDDTGDSLPVDKELKAASSRLDSDKGSKSKVLGDSKSKSSRRIDGSADKKEDSLNVIVEKEDNNKSGGRVDSRRKSDNDSTRRESRDKERWSERERKVHDSKHGAQTRAADGEVVRKQRSQVVDVGDGAPGKGGSENIEWSTQDDSQNPGLEQDLERRIERRGDSYIDKDKLQDGAKGSDEKRLSSRSDQAKDGKHKDERHKDRSHGDQYREDGAKDGRRRDDKSHDDGEKDHRHRDVKYWEDGEKYYRHGDNKNQDDGDKDTKRREDKFCEDIDRDNRHRDDRYREDSDRDHKYNDKKYREDGDRHLKYTDKYWEDGDVDHRQRDSKYLEDGDREKGCSNDGYREDVKRDDRHREDKYKEDGSRENRYKEENKREELDRDSRYWDIYQGDDVDREKRFRDTRYREERPSRDRNNGKSNAKRPRDESNVADYYRKSSNHDDSPSYGKRATRYKEDQGKKRAIDKEDHVESRYRSTKEERADIEKRSSSSAKMDGVPDRVRTSSRHVDMELNSSNGRHRDSPSFSSYAARDHYRMSKQEPRHRDYAHEEKAGHNIISIREYGGPSGANEKTISSRLVERHIHKDDGYFGELSAEKRLNSDVCASPLRLIHNSPSSTSTEHRNLNRSDVRGSLDVEDLGQRSGSSRDAKEGRGSRELPMDTIPMDEFSQVDGDNLSVSSPFPRGSHYSRNSRFPPPPNPPFRIGADNQLVFGSSDDDSRGKSGIHHRRTGDPNMGRVYGNSWKGVPNWTSPMANGYMPFQHAPPPVNFHPMMQQFPTPVFGVRPPLDLNHIGVPYHMPNADRFSGHVCKLGWSNSVDDSCPLHTWESNNAVFCDESHPYGRLDWDHGRTLSSSHERESRAEVWKGQNSGTNVDFPSTPHKEVHIVHAPGNETWTNQIVQQAQNEQDQSDHKSENVDISQLSETSERKTMEAPKTTFGEAPNLSELSKKGDAGICHIYLSKLDISVDLAQPELYDECKSIMNLNLNDISDDYDDASKILYVEGVVETKVMIAQKNSSVSLFAPICDAVYQKAISLYKKQREEFKVNGKNVPFSCLENLDFTPISGPEGLCSSDGKEGELVPVCNCEEIEGTVSDNHEKGEGPINIQNEEEFSAIPHQKSDDVAGRVEKLKETIPVLNMVKLVENPISNEERQEHIVEEKLMPKEIAENSDAHMSRMVGEEANMFSESGGNCSASVNNGQKFLETKCGRKSSDMFSEAIVESNESESVNLSRIHHSPESTH